MKIDITLKNGKKMRLAIPAGLLLNRLTAGIVVHGASKQGIALTRAQAVRLLRVLKECRRQHTGWKLIEVEAADGERVEITI